MTGVTVVTSREAGGIPRGFTANSFTSVSLQPPLLLICIDKAADGVAVFTAAPGFAVNVLAEEQVALSALFASKRADKFTRTQWVDSPNGYPLLSEVCAWFDCRQRQQIDAGDHIILIGEILAYDYNDRIGLGYVRGGYMRLALERAAAKASGSGAVVGAIIECDGKILLETEPTTGELQVPATGRDGKPGSLGQLQADFARRHLPVTISSLFAVFEHEQSGQQSIYYRAQAEGAAARDDFWNFDAIPWARIHSPAITSMLQRYIAEATRQRFGVYFGGERAGAVKNLAP